jgi:hypothetical protein
VYYTATTLDGFIADPEDSLDWILVAGGGRGRQGRVIVGGGVVAGQFADAGPAVLVAEAGELAVDPPVPQVRWRHQWVDASGRPGMCAVSMSSALATGNSQRSCPMLRAEGSRAFEVLDPPSPDKSRRRGRTGPL